jgi:hypothetical protein
LGPSQAQVDQSTPPPPDIAAARHSCTVAVPGDIAVTRRLRPARNATRAAGACRRTDSAMHPWLWDQSMPAQPAVRCGSAQLAAVGRSAGSREKGSRQAPPSPSVASLSVSTVPICAEPPRLRRRTHGVHQLSLDAERGQAPWAVVHLMSSPGSDRVHLSSPRIKARRAACPP